MLLKSYFNQTECNIQEFKYVKPKYPSTYKMLNAQNRCKTFYQDLNDDNMFPEQQLKLAPILNLTKNGQQDSTIKWFQYKFIHGI